MKKRTHPLIGGLLALTLAVSPTAQAAEDRPLTRGEARDILVAAADDYAGLSPEELLRGDDTGELYLDRPLSRVEALVLLERAFGGFAEPRGVNACNAFPAETFTDVPEWARTELEQTLRAGIVAGTGEGKLSPDRQVTAGELGTLIRRAYAYQGANLRDDYYATVNKTWLDAARIPEGVAVTGPFYEAAYAVEAQVLDMIPALASRPARTEAEEKLAAFYRTAVDLDSRNRAGIDPIRPYLEGIDRAGSVEELLEVELEIERETEQGFLLGFGLGVDLADSSRYQLYFGTWTPQMPKEFYLTGEEGITLRYLDYLTELLVLAGEGEEKAWEDARLAYELEWEIAGESLDIQEYGDAQKVYNLYTYGQLRKIYPGRILDGALENAGYRKEDGIRVSDVGAMEALAACLTEERLDGLKAVLKLELLRGVGCYLNQEFYEANDRFLTDYYYGGAQTQPDILWGAAQQTEELMGDYLSQIYLSDSFSPQAKADVEEMTARFIAAFKRRIQALDWMGEETKERAIKKLDTMVVKVGYPEDRSTYLDQAEILSPEEGGTYYANVLAIWRAWGDSMERLQGSRVDRGAWSMYPYETNACYEPSSNSITFPAAVLQSPMYDVNASRERNLGGIGYIIAHEITHAFDNDGAKFDEKGNADNWWTAEDYAAFQAKCAQVADWYDGQEWAPGLTCDGERTLSENVADLGAMACVMDVAGEMDDLDYDAVFRAMANIWNEVSSRDYQRYQRDSDIHAAGKLRVNRVLQALPQFYETYGIREGDGMWVPPEERVSIW